MANKKKKKEPEQLASWKPPVFKWALEMVGFVYIGLLLGCNYHKDDTIYELLPRISNRIGDGNLFNIGLSDGLKQPGTLFAWTLGCLLLGGLFILIDASANHNYMRGREFGTASWAKPATINQKFENENPSWNRVYSNELRISMKTDINNNVLVIGGSGVGKSFKLLTPNIYQADPKEKYPGSLIFTDPKGELLQKNGAYLRDKGYVVKVLNLVPMMMSESDCFNPFEYIRTEADVIKLINNLFANTTPKGASASDPFWEKAELMFLQSLFLIVWMEHDLFGWEMSFNQVLDLLSKAEILDTPSGQPQQESKLDEIFRELVEKTTGMPGKGDSHPAYLAYKKTMSGAADTKRSIIISANARLAIFENPEIKRILAKDELDLASIGTGLVNGKKDQKTALFCVIPDSDTSFNAIAGMLYTLLFQELYFQADFKYRGELPVPVTFWLDEFANIALPKDFIKMLTTMRSRLISCVIIIQNLAQLKALFEKEWEEIPGNCDVSVYLGGNEQSTFEYISKNLGKKTIYKKSTGETKGKNGSTSQNEDALGRELMLPEEVRELDTDYCVVFVRGKKPVLDYKFDTLHSPEFKRSVELGGYLHSQARQLARDECHITLVSHPELAEAYRLGRVIEYNLDEHLLSVPGYDELQQIIMMNEEQIQREMESRREIDIKDMSVTEILSYPGFVLSDDELVEVTEGLANGLSDEEVKSYILYGSAKRMKSQRLLLEALNKRKAVVT